MCGRVGVVRVLCVCVCVCVHHDVHVCVLQACARVPHGEPAWALCIACTN